MSVPSRSTHHAHALIIIIDPDALRRSQHQEVLEQHGFGHVHGLAPAEALPDALSTASWALILIDLDQDHAIARAQVARLRSACPQAVLVATTAPGDDAAQARALSGSIVVSEILTHPLAAVALVAVVRRLFTQHLAGPAEGVPLPERHVPPPAPPQTLTPSPSAPYPSLMTLIATRPEAVFGLAPLLVIGETGCEARHWAEEIHGHAGRSGRFAQLGVAHADAKHLRQCLIECRLGTLFIAELAALSAPAQDLLITALRRQAAKPTRSVRVIIAHEPSLPLGGVRPELQRVLAENRIVLPALRTIPAQIPLLIQRILAELATRQGWGIPPLPTSLPDLIADYDFPGDLTELRELVTAAVADSQGGAFALGPFRTALERGQSRPHHHATSALLRDLEQLPSLRDIQRLLIEEALRRTRNHPSEAAAMLGISRQALHKRLQGPAFDRLGGRGDPSGADSQVSRHQ